MNEGQSHHREPFQRPWDGSQGSTSYSQSPAFGQQHRPYQQQEHHHMPASDLPDQDWSTLTSAMPDPQGHQPRSDLGQPYGRFHQPPISSIEPTNPSSQSSMLSSPASWSQEPHNELEASNHDGRPANALSGPSGHGHDQSRQVSAAANAHRLVSSRLVERRETGARLQTSTSEIDLTCNVLTSCPSSPLSGNRE